MTVLVLTCEEDVTADLVVRKLGDKVLRADPAHFPARIRMSVNWQGGRLTGSIESGMRHARLQDIRAVWVRRPGKPGVPGGPQKRWADYECLHAFMGALRALPNVRWMNPPDAQDAAKYKLHQLNVAHSVGLMSPSTLITTDSQDASAYLKGLENVVCKSISGRQPDDPPMNLPTTPIPPQTNLTRVNGFPTCFQRAVEKVADIRLTVVGEKLFCARTMSGPGDWRYAPNLRWHVAQVPKGIAPRIMKMMKMLGLSYGAFDFAEDLEGRWWFLEVNPAGQFSFIENGTDLPISQEIAHWLLGS